jgi:putative acetyltransferase
MQIRQAANEDDINAARALFQEYADSLGIDLSYQGFSEELANLPGRYVPPRGRLLIAWTEMCVVGCIGLRPHAESACEIKRLYVRPEFRNLGIGRRLAEAIIFEAKQIGFALIRLDTLPTMTAAIRLYESLGFRQCEPYYDTPIADTVFMAIQLKP